MISGQLEPVVGGGDSATLSGGVSASRLSLDTDSARLLASAIAAFLVAAAAAVPEGEEDVLGPVEGSDGERSKCERALRSFLCLVSLLSRSGVGACVIEANAPARASGLF